MLTSHFLPGDGAPATTMMTGTPVAATPSPVQTGIPKGCGKFYLVKSGDTCAGIAAAEGVSLVVFEGLNPAVGNNCSGLIAGYWVCVQGGTGGTARRRKGRGW